MLQYRVIERGADWHDGLTCEEVNTIRDLCATAQRQCAGQFNDVDVIEGCFDSVSFWIGLLLGSGSCADLKTAAYWATFIVYDVQNWLEVV